MATSTIWQVCLQRHFLGAVLKPPLIRWGVYTGPTKRMGFNFDKSSQSGGGGGGKIRRRMGGGAWAGPTQIQTNPYWRLTDKSNNQIDYYYGALSKGAGTSFTSVPPQSTLTYSFSLSSSQWMDLLVFATNNTYPSRMVPIYLNVNGSTLTSSQIALAGYTRGASGFYNTLDVYGYGNSVTAKWYNPNNYSRSVAIGTVLPPTVISPSGSIQWPPALTGRYVYRDTF